MRAFREAKWAGMTDEISFTNPPETEASNIPLFPNQKPKFNERDKSRHAKTKNAPPPPVMTILSIQCPNVRVQTSMESTIANNKLNQKNMPYQKDYPKSFSLAI